MAAFCSYGILNHSDMRPLSLVAAVSLLASAPLAGQEPNVPHVTSGCTYDNCALRLERRRLLRGAHGQPVIKIGAWGAPSLRPHVVPSDSALTYAAQFDRHYTVGTRIGMLGLLGAAVMGAVYAHYEHSGNELSDRAMIVQLSGIALSFGLTLYGGRRVDRAMEGLTRAIWWSNRELPR